MKKFVFYFIWHIGCALTFFNPCSAAAEDFPLPVEKNVKADTAPADKETVEKTNKKSEPVLKSNNEIAKFIFVPFLIDKLYPEGEINRDFTSFLQQIYPTTNVEKLQTYETWIKYFVSLKRRYQYVVQMLEQKVKALALLPQDAPIVAEDGEYAPDNPDQRKQTPDDQYRVSYHPYKYLEYDPGESGEPVRRRDKNYVEDVNINEEVTLALLKFDIPAFYRALKKLPPYTDGSGEKPVVLPNGVKARLLLGLSAPGDAEKIRGVIDMYIPKGYYITGDYLDQTVRPRFILDEDKNNKNNIKSYQLYHPAPASVFHNGRSLRLFSGSVRFPIELTRADTEKGINIAGTFQFELCEAASDRCHTEQTVHALKLKPSDRHEFSVYNNYVAQTFAHLPQAQSAHARLEKVIYNPQNGKLKINFAVSRKFSNVAAMVESRSGISFSHPRYAITDNEIVAEFESAPSACADCPVADVAVTALFDDYESLRQVVAPMVMEDTAQFNRDSFTPPDWLDAFAFGLWLNLMPGIFYLFARVVGYFWQKKHRYAIFARYAGGLAIGWALLFGLYHHRYFSEMYTNAWLNAAAALIVVSLLMECLLYMDFDLFRPLKRFTRRGWLMGFFSVLLCATIPMYRTPEILNYTWQQNPSQMLLFASAIWLGMLCLPALALLFHNNASRFLFYQRRFNIFYNLLFLAAFFYMLYMSRGLNAALAATVFLLLAIALWYIYPQAFTIAAKQTRSLKQQERIFHTIQRHALMVVLTLYALMVLILSLFPPRQPLLAPSPAQVQKLAQSYNRQGYPVIVAITADWSPASLLNRQDARRLKEAGFKVIQINADGNAQNAAPWFKEYGRYYAPLNILFTSRHPQGILLPSQLRQVNWETALKNFTRPQERNSHND